MRLTIARGWHPQYAHVCVLFSFHSLIQKTRNAGFSLTSGGRGGQRGGGSLPSRGGTGGVRTRDDPSLP